MSYRLFNLKKPRMIGIGFDNLPEYLYDGDLTKNELAKLASIDRIPNYFMKDSEGCSTKNEIFKNIKKYLHKNDLLKAWKFACKLQSINE